MFPRKLLTTALATLVLGTATGCPKKQAPPAPAPAGSSTLGGSLGRAPEGGSTTVFGKARDRAVDIQIMTEMRQARLAIDADFPDGKGPADKAAWLALLRDFRVLRPLVESGEVVACPGVNVQRQKPD